MRPLAWLLSLSLLVALGPGCRRAHVRATARGPAPAPSSGDLYAVDRREPVPGQPSVQAEVGGQLLYLPVEATMLPLHLIQAVYVQTHDGRHFQLTAADVTQGLGGRLAVRVPPDVTTGTATIYLTNGQSWSTTFHVAARSQSMSVGVAPMTSGQATDPRCTLPAGMWQGTITDAPNARSVVWLEVLGDCRTVRGYVHLMDGEGGSVDSTIEGTWDPGSGAISARDTQLFNVRPMPGGGFCATDEYRLQISPDGRTIQGQNITYQLPCRGIAPVRLVRAR